MYDIPILILGYNRPYNIKRLLSILSSIKPTRLYISIDGPPNDEIAQLGRECAGAADSIDWECTFHIQKLGKNHGGAVGPAKGISWFFANEEFGIIFDDDVEPRKEFFEYIRHCRDEFRHDQRVGAVSGNNFASDKTNFWNGKCGLSRFFFGWGWATWRDRWLDFKLNGDSLASFVYSENAIKTILYNDESLATRWIQIFERWRNGAAWDYLWQFHLWKNGLDTIIPPVNLVGNIGIGSDSTNCVSEFPFMVDWKNHWNLTLPDTWRDGVEKSEIGDRFNSYVCTFGIPASTLYLQSKASEDKTNQP